MIHIISKEQCCGCNACVQKCPSKCVTMHEDEEGFMYPVVDENRCIDCHLCEKVCPVINQGLSKDPSVCLAVKNGDEEVRMKSSSGGFFSLVAEQIISEGGVVFGASFNEKWTVVHRYTESRLGIAQFRGSKYVQSSIGTTFIQAEKFLRQGRKVLFSGTPCQISALRLYLGKEYDNLLCVDFVCHGVPSPGVFRWYLQETINNNVRGTLKNSVSLSPIHSIPKGDVHVPFGMEIMDIHFRDKREGWKKFSFALQLAEASAEGKKNTVSLSANCQSNTFLKGFLCDLYLRPSCYKCPCKHFKSGSDITMADFWGQEYTFPDFDNDKGVSAVFPNTEKGVKYVECVSRVADITERPFADFLSFNPSVFGSSQIKNERVRFWKLPQKYSLERRIYKACQPTLKKRLLHKIKYFLHL